MSLMILVALYQFNRHFLNVHLILEFQDLKFDFDENKIPEKDLKFDLYENKIQEKDLKFDLDENKIRENDLHFHFVHNSS